MDKKEKEYKEELKRIDAQRVSTKKKVLSSHVGLREAVNKFKGIDEASVDWKDLKAFPIDQWIEIFPGVFAKKYYEDTETIKFKTLMKPNSAFKWHFHKDCKEFANVIMGELYEAVTETTYKAGETVFYPAGLKHIPTNPSESDNLLDVVFYYERSN